MFVASYFAFRHIWDTVRDGIKPCEMKKRRLLFATKVEGQLYMCEGGRKEKGGKGQYVPSRTLKKKLALCLKIGSLNRRSKGMEVPRFLLSKRAARAPAPRFNGITGPKTCPHRFSTCSTQHHNHFMLF